MKRECLLFVCALLTFFWLKPDRANAMQKKGISPRVGGLHRLAQKAKLEGKKALTFESPSERDYLGAESDLDDASRYYGVVLATLIEKKTATHQEDELVTWYRLRVVETLSKQSQQSLKAMDDQDTSANRPPADLFNLKDDEFAVGILGGELNVDGVEINQTNKDFPPLVEGKTYLIFTALNSKRQGFIGGGPNGLLMIDGDGRIRPISNGVGPIARDIQARFGNSLYVLRLHLATAYKK